MAETDTNHRALVFALWKIKQELANVVERGIIAMKEFME